MAQIPRINRIEPGQGPQNARIDMQVQDRAGQIMQTSNAIASVADQAIDIEYRAENQKIETLGNLAEQEFTAWNTQELGKLKAIEGDPTDHYKAYDESVKKKREDMLTSRPEITGRVRSFYESKIDRTIATQNIAALKQRGAQQETFEHTVFENTLKLKKDGMATTAGYITAGDPSSYTMFEQNMNDMKTAIAKRGFKNGTAVRVADDAEAGWNHAFQDEEGKIVKVKLTDNALMRFAKERAEGLKNSIDVMTASGKVTEAKEMREKYGDALDGRSKAQVDTKIGKAGRKDEANAFLQENDGLDPDEFLMAMEDVGDQELKTEILKQKRGQEANIEFLRTTSQKRNYDFLAKDLMQRQKSDRPFTSIAQLEEDKKFKLAYDKLSPKQQKSITEMVESPKESDPKALARVQEKFFNGEVNDMNPEDFQAELNGLDKAEKSKWNTRYFNLKSDTAGEKRSTYGVANKLLTDGLVEAGFIERDDRNRVTGEDANILYRARANMIEVMDHLGPQSPEQIQQLVKKFTAKEIKDKAFKTPQVSLDGVKKKAGQKSLSETQLKKAKVGFKAKYGRYPGPKDDQLFNAFAQANT